MKTALEVIKEFTPRPDFDYSGTWVVDAMESYKNQSQPIEKDEMLIMAADAYKDLLSRYKELEAQLKEFQILVYQMLVYFNNASPLTLATMSEDEYVKRFIKAKHEVIKALESSPTEQPEAQKSKWNDAASLEKAFEDVFSCIEDGIKNTEQQNQPQPEKEEQTHSISFNECLEKEKLPLGAITFVEINKMWKEACNRIKKSERELLKEMIADEDLDNLCCPACGDNVGLVFKYAIKIWIEKLHLK